EIGVEFGRASRGIGETELEHLLGISNLEKQEGGKGGPQQRNHTENKRKTRHGACRSTIAAEWMQGQPIRYVDSTTGFFARRFTPLDLLAARCSRILKASSALSAAPARPANCSAVKASPAAAFSASTSFCFNAITPPAAFLPASTPG